MVAGLSLAAATSAGAQTANVVLTAGYAPGAGAVTAFGYYMSPYSGTVDDATTRLNCVDFFHEVSLGEVWTATVTNLGAAIADNSLLGITRDGSTGGYSLSDALKLYEQAAWLTAQMPTNPASDPNMAVAIQTAIWSIVDNGPTLPSSLKYATTNNYWADGQVNTIQNTGTGSTGYWIARAQSEYALQDAGFYDNFNVLTGVGNPGAGAQEFIYATPEPGTLVLFGSGLIGMVGFVRIRRRKGANETVVSGAIAS